MAGHRTNIQFRNLTRILRVLLGTLIPQFLKILSKLLF